MIKTSCRPVFFAVLIILKMVNASDNVPDREKTSLLDSVISQFTVKYCCQSSLEACLKKKDSCTIATRLYDFANWLVQLDTGHINIMKQLEKRYEGFTDTTHYSIDTSRLKWAGSPEAPVRVIVYVSSTCNLCKLVTGEIYDSVRVGKLSGKVKLMIIPFGSGIGDIALYAADSDGRLWELFEAMRKNSTRYKEEDILNMAREVGIEKKKFKQLLNNPRFRNSQISAREEGTKNGVEVTPTIFINEKRYRSYKDPQWIIDAALFEFDKIKSASQN